MSLGKATGAQTFNNHAQGTLGEFITPAGRVSYLMTKARLGVDSTDPERRLTQHLVPFREVIPTEELDFNQLLQRDLDDHRVAVNLVPYLLNPDTSGPAFYPPIVAIALPFEKQRPSHFPLLRSPTNVGDGGLSWQQQDAGQFMRVRRLLGDHGEISHIPLGEIWWNGEFCKIVVVDGQHRAMSLLAIDRTIRGTWHEGSGSRFRYFYENRIRDALKERGAPLDHVEVPVTILWFPDKFGPDESPHKAARKVFVDVNKEARTPSESRLILLSDSELVNIFTRTTLTQLRNQSSDEYLPLYCIEYDNPDTKSTQSARWSALTNIHALKQVVNRVVFGPPKFVNSVSIAMGRRESEDEKNEFMRKQLRVVENFPPILDGDEQFARDQLGNKDFPETALPILCGAYRDTWSRAILTLLSDVLPYSAHAKALSQLKENWFVDDSIASLAYDALFGGVGMFWTLRDAAHHWHSDPEKPEGSSKPDVVKAWELITSKQDDFEALRAEALLGSAAKKDVANQVYQALNTHACQIGLALTLVTLNQRAAVSQRKVEDLAKSMASGINAWMLSKTSGEYDRRIALAKRRGDWPKNAFNVITNMDMPRAIQFRYFWLEILNSPESAPHLDGIADPGEVARLLAAARRSYVSYVASEKQRALRTSDPTLSDQQRKVRAIDQAIKEVRQALIRWFGYSATDVEEWVSFEPDDNIEADGSGPESDDQLNIDPPRT